jgi:hypothetical protein
MSDERELRPISKDEAWEIPLNTWNLGGPLTVKNSAYAGTTDYLCPSCKAVLVLQTNSTGIATLKRLPPYERTSSEGCRTSMTLPPARLLRLRSAMTLDERLRMCIEEREALSPGLFSPTDILTLSEIAAELPRERQAFLDLANAIEEQVRRA